MYHQSCCLLALGLLGTAVAHGGGHGGEQKPVLDVDANADWMTKHMAEEHHASGFDSSSFFSLHDYNSDGHWEPDEFLRTYGLMDESNEHVSEARRDEIRRDLLAKVDRDGDARISRAEFERFIAQGNTLPDYGTGPGHHGDDEYEYEIHHWEKYHDDSTTLDDLTHPEDIEHFRKHEQMEEAELRLEMMEKMPIIESNIPGKFRRSRT